MVKPNSLSVYTVSFDLNSRNCLIWLLSDLASKGADGITESTKISEGEGELQRGKSSKSRRECTGDGGGSLYIPSPVRVIDESLD
jgi:hypothetical protein